MSKKLLLIINPRSGLNKPKGFFEKIEKVFVSDGWETTVEYTDHRNHATEIAETAGEYDRVICVGGDGTLNESANGIMKLEKRVEFGYVPAGSTNDFACGIGLPKSVKKSAKLASTGEVNCIDLGTFTNDAGEKRYFSYVASFGFFTKISYSTDQKIKNVFGHMAYIFEGIKSVTDLQNYKPFKLRIETEGSVIEQEYIFGAVTNSTSLGGLVKLDKKHVHVNDGLFELLLIRKPKNVVELTDTVGQLVGHKYKADSIIFSHTDAVKLISETPLDWTLDGEYAGSTAMADIKVVKDALDFIRPDGVRKKPFLVKKEP